MQIVLKPFYVFAKAILRSWDNEFSVSKYVTAQVPCLPVSGIILLTNQLVGYLVSQSKTDNSLNVG